MTTRVVVVCLILLCGLPAGACGARSPRNPPASTLIVDVHAHVLHAEDVPLRGFGEKVLGLPRWLARLLESWLQGKGESSALFRTLATSPGRLEEPIDEARLRELLRATLRDLEPEVRMRTAPGIDERFVLERFDLGQAALEDEQADAELRRALELVLAQPSWTEPPAADGELRTFLEVRLAEPCRAAEPDLFEQLAGLYRFASILRQDDPSRVAELYFETFGDGGDGQPHVDLVTPAMMNMRSWLGQGSRHDVDAQIQELGQLVRARRGRVHPFFAFDPCDPWEKSRRQLEEALALGFVGVKVYPPMGYLPWRNVGRPPACPPLPCPAEAIDAHLEALYGTCQDEGIPILAHCSNGGAEACAGSGRNADPDGWRPVLDAFPELRLSFGHFGGDDFVRRGGWAQKIVALMRAYPRAKIYADLSYHDWPFDDAVRACYAEALGELLAEGPPVSERILFGSDWSMIAREPWQGRYVSDLLRLIAEKHPAHLERIAGQNALDYLGLREGEKNRGRLQRYYAAQGIDPAEVPWLRRR